MARVRVDPNWIKERKEEIRKGQFTSIVMNDREEGIARAIQETLREIRNELCYIVILAEQIRNNQ